MAEREAVFVFEIRYDGAEPRLRIVIKAECYDNKGVLKDAVKARHDELVPGEIWTVKSRSRWFRSWVLVELSSADL